MESQPGEVTQLLRKMKEGDQDAASKLTSLVYDQLRRLAAHYMRGERSDHTLQPTALVHEVYLKLVDQHSVDWQSRAHFFGAAAELMRRILVDFARRNLRLKRGGKQEKVSLDDVFVFSEERSSELVVLDEALTRLAKLDPRQSRIVELRFFAGLTVEEAAEALKISPKTVKRDYSVARAWLHGELRKQHQ